MQSGWMQAYKSEFCRGRCVETEVEVADERLCWGLCYYYHLVVKHYITFVSVFDIGSDSTKVQIF